MANSEANKGDVVFRRINGRIVPIRRKEGDNTPVRSKGGGHAPIKRSGAGIVSAKVAKRSGQVHRALTSAPVASTLGFGFGASLYATLAGVEHNQLRIRNKASKIIQRKSYRAMRPSRPKVWDLFSAAKFERESLLASSGKRRIAQLTKRMKKASKVAGVLGRHKGKLALAFGVAVGASHYLSGLSEE